MYSMYRSATIRVCVLVVCLLMLSFNRAEAAGDASVRVINTAGGGSVTVKVRNIGDNQLADGGLITWNGIEAGTAGWKISDQYLEVSKEDLPVFWGMQIYSDNKAALADPKYTGTRDPAGLVRVDNTIISLPMAWRITDTLLSGAGLADPVERSTSRGFEDYLWHFLKDKNTPDDPLTLPDETFTNGEDYSTLWNQSGIGWNEGARSGNPKKAYIYLAAKFTMASVDTTYRTSRLTVEAFHGTSPFPIYLYKDAPATLYPNEPGATLENHFASSGWANYNAADPHMSVDAKCTDVTPHSGAHCFKLNWNGKKGADNGKWGTIMWLEPEDIWELGGNSPTHDGYDLRGADYISFWARTDSDDTGMQINVFFGNGWDSSGSTHNAFMWMNPPLDMEWEFYVIPVTGYDMSDITGGFAVHFNKDHVPNTNGCNIYLDDIKFDKY